MVKNKWTYVGYLVSIGFTHKDLGQQTQVIGNVGLFGEVVCNTR
jgi:hypothetical protein